MRIGSDRERERERDSSRVEEKKLEWLLKRGKKKTRKGEGMEEEISGLAGVYRRIANRLNGRLRRSSRLGRPTLNERTNERLPPPPLFSRAGPDPRQRGHGFLTYDSPPPSSLRNNYYAPFDRPRNGVRRSIESNETSFVIRPIEFPQ